MSENLDRIVSEASVWSRFFGLGPVTYTDDQGVVHKPEFEMGDYD